MFNTPPVVPIYTALETMRYIKAEGGVAEMERRSKERASVLYNEIDRNPLFRGTCVPEDRSLMNVCFVMATSYEKFESEFLNFASERGIIGINGHRSAGGFRASLYNALPTESVTALVQAMQDFERKINR